MRQGWTQDPKTKIWSGTFNDKVWEVCLSHNCPTDSGANNTGQIVGTASPWWRCQGGSWGRCADRSRMVSALMFRLEQAVGVDADLMEVGTKPDIP